MTNAEKYLKDEASIEELIFDIINFEKCWNRKDFDKEVKRIKKFFFTSLAPTLTEDERVILRNARTWGNEKFRYIMRTAYGLRVTANAFHCSENEPEEEGFDLYAFDHLFQFIKERRRIFY